MIIVWMQYALAIGGCAVVAASALEAMLGSAGRPRRWVWVAALVAAVGVPAAVAVRPVPRAEAAVLPAGRLSAAAVAAPTAASARWTGDRLAMVAWGGASLLLAVVVAAGAWRLRRARREGRVVTLDGEPVTLTRDTGPGALWMGWPRILAPQWVTAIAAEHRALLLRHEREHVRAGDPALLAASIGALVVMPWNAALWVIAARLRTALELDCDARVLAAGADPHAYGELLLTVAAARRAPALAAYLAFASPSSPLERRIRAMSTSTRPLGGWRRSLLPLVVVAATLVACETRRPEPLAPVGSYTIADGRAEAAKAPSNTDSARTALAGEVRRAASAADTAAGGADSDPLVMVYDARGALVRSFRLPARGTTGTPVLDAEYSPAQIATVEVVKNGALLPAEARGGVIRITLKEGAAAGPAASGEARAPSATGASGSVRLRAAVAPQDSLASGTSTTRGAAPGGALRLETRAPAPGDSAGPAGAPTVVVIDATGRELLRREDSTQDMLRNLPVDEAMIERAEVVKRGPLGGRYGTIYLYLKPGATLRPR